MLSEEVASYAMRSCFLLSKVQHVNHIDCSRNPAFDSAFARRRGLEILSGAASAITG
jgi:hypothetical protein